MKSNQTELSNILSKCKNIIMSDEMTRLVQIIDDAARIKSMMNLYVNDNCDDLKCYKEGYLMALSQIKIAIEHIHN